jgi:hypothetical protein
MYIREHLLRQTAVSRMRAMRSHYPLFATALSCGVLFTGLALITACGSEGGSIVEPVQPPPPPPPPPAPVNPIPEQVFEVTISNPSNNCQLTTDLGSSSFLTLPQHVADDSYNMLGVLDSPVPAQFTGDKLVFKAPVAVESGVATLGADWVFSTDRHSFTGSTTLDVRADNGKTCLFTFATAGTLQVVSSLGSVPSSSQPKGAAAGTRIAALYTATGGIGSVPPQYKSGAPGTILNGLPVECRPDGIIVWGGSQAGIQAGDANLPGSNPVAVTVFFQRYDPASGETSTEGSWAFGGDLAQSGPVQAPDHDWLWVSPAENKTVGIFFGGYLGAALVPVKVGSTPAVVGWAPTVKLINPSAGWYKVWVRYDWYYAGGNLVGSAWLVFDDAQAYIGIGAQIDSNGWCYVSG